MGAGVAGAIKRAGGEEIEREAVSKGPIAVGDAVATGAGRLPARYVVHGAVMGQDLRTNAGLIEKTTTSCLEVADELGVSSLALPAFGTGVGGFALDECARIMVGRCAWLRAEGARACRLCRLRLGGGAGVRDCARRRSAGAVKGVVLAGGSGTRLHPLTRITNKHLLPIYNRPMVSYAIEALVKCRRDGDHARHGRHPRRRVPTLARQRPRVRHRAPLVRLPGACRRHRRGARPRGAVRRRRSGRRDACGQRLRTLDPARRGALRAAEGRGARAPCPRRGSRASLRHRRSP